MSDAETATRINVATSSKVITRQQDAGDGTVPLWSALPKSGQKQLVVGEHSKFFVETGFKAVFFRLFGKNFPAPPTTAAGALSATLSVQALTLRTTDPVELLVIPVEPVDRIKGKIILERTETPERPFAKLGKAIAVAYAGPPTPSLTLKLPPITKPGAYRFRFEGEPTAGAPVMFAVTQT